MVNYNQAYLESLVKPGSTRLLIVRSLVSLAQPWFTRLTRLLTRLLAQGIDSEDDYRTGCRNVSHCHQRQSRRGVATCTHGTHVRTRKKVVNKKGYKMNKK